LVYQQFGMGGFLVGFIFLFLLGLGMAYEWRKGDLEWIRPELKHSVLKKTKTEKQILKEETVA